MSGTTTVDQVLTVACTVSETWKNRIQVLASYISAAGYDPADDAQVEAYLRGADLDVAVGYRAADCLEIRSIDIDVLGRSRLDADTAQSSGFRTDDETEVPDAVGSDQ